MRSFNNKMIQWASGPNGLELLETKGLLQYLGENLYTDFEPAYGPYPDYFSRLEKWLENVSSDSDQQDLLRLAKRVFYVGREEFNSLYRTAFKTHYIRWAIDQEDICISASDAHEKILRALQSTWFCPVSDSLRINQFYHINDIEVRHEFRPDWRSLKKFGDSKKIKQYIQDNDVKYLVLLEDFVGSGTQSSSPIKFAAELDPGIKVLFLPLIICPLGHHTITAKTNGLKNLTISPVLNLNDIAFVDPQNKVGEDPVLVSLRTIIKKNKPEYCDRNTPIGSGQKYGYKEMGCLLVMHTNVPNNSLPLIYYEAKNDWNPLFRRHHRSKQ